MTREDLQKKYQTLSNSELLEIVNNKHHYTDTALLVAIEEFARRNVSENEIQELKEQEISNAETTLRKYILYDLTFFQKNFFYFVWFPLLNFAVKQGLREDGFVLKVRQATYYSLFGFLMLMLDVFISVAFDLSTLPSLAIWILGFLPVYAYDGYFNRVQQIAKIRELFENTSSGSEKE
jgi:hypothetical protein